MFKLPDALAALGRWRQFCLYKIVPSQSRPGKTDKFPINPLTGFNCDAHDPAIWMDPDTAAAHAAAYGDGYGVGFVFTALDPFWFIDIDECLEPGGWSATANALMTRFAGAAVEVSASGRGLHIIGSGDAGPPPPARKVKYAHYFDLYTENRFCALTGTSAAGDAATIHTPALAQLVAEYLTPDASTLTGWTAAPREDWSGPADDDDLIRFALNSLSGPQMVGRKASFADLWHGDAAKLAQFWPDPHRAEGFDRSTADSALAQALAFWTGNDCERIRRLMLKSGLARDKWHREDYLPRTITGVVGRQYDVLKVKPIELHTAGEPAKDIGDGQTFLGRDAQHQLFSGCVYICNKNRVMTPGGKLLKQEQFRVMFGGYTFAMDEANEKVTCNAYEAFTESRLVSFPKADGITFRPEHPPATIFKENGKALANIWWPIQTPAMAGDVGPFIRHMEKLLPNADDRAKLLSYMCAVVQFPGRKFQWAPLLQGVEGNGKTFLLTCIARAVGSPYYHFPNAQDLTGNGNKFTAWLEQKLFIGVEEIYGADRRELVDTLKPFITNREVEIQAKGQDQTTGENRANFMACSNHKDAIPKSVNDRRWAIFYCAQQNKPDLERDGMAGDYMPQLWDWAEADGFAMVTHFLRTWQIPDELNPATKMHRAPDTTSTMEAIGLAIGVIEEEIMEAIGQEVPGFAGGWVSSMALDRLLHRLGAERRVSPRRRREIMKGLGYEHHPHLPEGRVTHLVEPDNGRTRLFVRSGHIAINQTLPAAIAKMYEEAQVRALTARASFGIDAAGNKA